jgi:outer membrane receptor for ferrienterochelin and colicin
MNRQKNSLYAVWLTSVVSTLLSAMTLPAGENPSDNLFEMSLEELMNVPVVSASRIPTETKYLSAATTVITAEDIHYSGATSIPEILQFAPGMDVRRLDRNRYIVGVRGLFGTFSDRTLVLIDGRPATNPAFGTTHWETLPVLMEDIARIEIVRGPVGAAWGANAFTGVINIITKKPQDTPGGLISTTINEYGDTYTSLRYGQTQGKWSWKASAGYDNTEDSDAAGAGRYISGTPALNSLMGFDSFTARDWGRFWKSDLQGEYRANDQTRWSFGAAHTSGQQGDYEFLGVFPRRDMLSEYTRLFARMDHQIDKDTNFHVQWFGNYMDYHYKVFTDRLTYLQNDLEVQLTFKPADDHTASVGGNIRWDHITQHNDSSLNVLDFDKNKYDEYWAGLFLIDRWTVTQRLTLEGQLRLDDYSETTTDWSGRFMALYAMDEQQNHIVRAGFARSFRAPSVGIRRASSNYLQAPFIGSIFRTESPDGYELDNEGTYSLEAGYTGQLSDNFSINVDTYYQRMEDLAGARISRVGPVTNSKIDNINGASSWGAEPSLTWQYKAVKITGWYAYNGFKTDEFAQLTRSTFPSQHKAGLTGRYNLDNDWIFNANYAFQNSIHTYKTTAVDYHTSNRLDLTLSRKFAKGKGELMFGVMDVLNETSAAVFDSGNMASLETPGRTFFTRLQLHF